MFTVFSPFLLFFSPLKNPSLCMDLSQIYIVSVSGVADGWLHDCVLLWCVCAVSTGPRDQICQVAECSMPKYFKLHLKTGDILHTTTTYYNYLLEYCTSVCFFLEIWFLSLKILMDIIVVCDLHVKLYTSFIVNNYIQYSLEIAKVKIRSLWKSILLQQKNLHNVCSAVVSQ